MKKTAILTRQKNTDGKQTKGILRSGTFVCDTLELPWKDNKKNVSCIPTGTYECSVAHMQSMNIDAYLLSNVENRDGIFIHPGNYAFGKKVDTSGCILIGNAFEDRNGDGTDDVVNSRLTFAKFMAYFGNEPFTLIIQDERTTLETVPVVEIPKEPVVQVATETPVEAPKLTNTKSLDIDKVLDYLVTSSSNPEAWSMTAKSVIVAQVPLILYVLNTLGIHVDQVPLIAAVNTFFTGASITMGAFGVARKIYYRLLPVYQYIKSYIDSKK